MLLLGVNDFRLTPANVFAHIDDAQRILAEELLCLEKSTAVLAFTSGAATEPTGFYRIKLLVLGSGTTIQPTEISVEEYDGLDRTTPTVGYITGQFYKRWAGTITTFPALDDGNYTMYYYGVPTTNASTSVDPEISAVFDNCIQYYVAMQLAPVVGRMDLMELFSRLYALEKERVQGTWARTKPSNYSIDYQDV